MKKILLSLSCLMASGTLWAVDPSLTTVSPTGIQRGTEAELTFSGRRLADTVEVVLYDKGVTVQKIVKADDKSVVVMVKVSPGCELGEQKVRLRSKTGLSDLRTFYVGPFKQVEEAEKKSENNERATAEPLAKNVTLLGRISTEDVDHYVFEAKKGENISAEIEAIRLARSFFDPYMAILDKDGKILKRNDDNPLLIQDSFLTLIAPYDGKYFVQIRETSFLGRNDLYRLHFGNFPRPHAVYPPGGPAGQSVDVKFIGDAGGDIKQSVLLPEVYNPKMNQGIYAERRGLISPSANPVRVGKLPNVLEKEPNENVKDATWNEEHQTVPLAFNGLIEKDKDEDYFKFKATKGQSLYIKCYSRRLRSKLDTAVYLYDEKGKYLRGATDTGGADGQFTYTIPNDGYYFVRVRDELGNHGPDCTYRVEVTLNEPDIAVYLPDTRRYDTQTRKAVMVARGNRFASLFYIRRENFSGDLEFEAQNLPKGMKLIAGIWPKAVTSYPVVFEVADDAPIGGSIGNILVKTPKSEKVQVKGGVWQNYDLVQSGNRGTFYETWLDKISFAVVEKLPFKVHVEVPKTPIVRYGFRYLKIKVDREKGYDDPIRVTLLFKPPGIGSSSYITIPKGKTEGSYYISANGGAAIGDWKTTFLAEATVDGGRAWSSTDLFDFKIDDYFVSGKIPLVTTEQGKDCKIICEVTHKTPFEGKATITLGGMPNGATTEPLEITKDTKEIVFNVKVTDKARIGYNRNLFCDFKLKKDGEEIVHRFSYNGRFRIDAPQKLVAQATTEKK